MTQILGMFWQEGALQAKSEAQRETPFPNKLRNGQRFAILLLGHNYSRIARLIGHIYLRLSPSYSFLGKSEVGSLFAERTFSVAPAFSRTRQSKTGNPSPHG